MDVYVSHKEEKMQGGVEKGGLCGEWAKISFVAAAG